MKLKYSLIIFLCLTTVFSFAQTPTPTLRINEFSNGPSGNREWVELAVVSSIPHPPTAGSCFNYPLNVTGWILDDNNGDFSPTNYYQGSGISTGYIRFKDRAPWNKLPLGALIVIYNFADKDLILPADDTLDANSDGTYVFPSNHSSLEYCTNAPAATNCTTVSAYSAGTTFGTGLWSNVIPLTNGGDGIQIRDASFNQVHGVVYGKTTATCGVIVDVVGTAKAPLIDNLSGTNKFYAYNGATVADYTVGTSWITGAAASATPGTFNSTNNQTLLTGIRNGCIFSGGSLSLEIPELMTMPRVRLPFKVAQNHTSLIFTTSSPYMLTFRVYNLNGVMIEMFKAPLVKTYEYKLNKKAPYIVNVTAENVSGHIHNHSFKVTY